MDIKRKMQIAERVADREYGHERNSNYYAFRSGVLAGINYILMLEADLQRKLSENKVTGGDL